MCLNAGHKSVDRALTEKAVVRWKVFDSWQYDGLSFCCFYYSGHRSVPRGKWLRSLGDGSLSIEPYPLGFHSYTTQEAAYRSPWIQLCYSHRVVTKVLVRGIHTEGTDNDLPTVVSDWLYVPADGEDIEKERLAWQ